MHPTGFSVSRLWSFDQLSLPLHIMPDCAHPVKRRAGPPKDEGGRWKAGKPRKANTLVTCASIEWQDAIPQDVEEWRQQL